MLCGSRPGVQSASPKTPKNTPSPQGSHSPYILRDTTRPRHVTYDQVSSKSDQRRLRKTLHKQTDKPTDTTKIMVNQNWSQVWSPFMTSGLETKQALFLQRRSPQGKTIFTDCMSFLLPNEQCQSIKGTMTSRNNDLITTQNSFVRINRNRLQ